jgi:DNA-binding transcriptional LysR family regulator
MFPTITELKYFLAVVDTLNLRRAAERLRVSQPCLSMAARRLEDAVGAALLVRNKSGVQLTRAGKRLVPKARALLEEWNKVLSETSREEAEVAGQYLLGCSETLGMVLLPLFLPKLMRTHPDLTIELVHAVSPRIMSDVANYKMDFGIVANPLQHPDLVVRPICSDAIRLWVGQSVNPTQDLESGQAVLVYDPSAYGMSILRQFKKGIVFRRTVFTSSAHVAASMVAAGLGIAILPEMLAALHPGMRPLPADLLQLPRELCLIYRSDAQRSPASRQLAREIESTLREVLRRSHPPLSCGGKPKRRQKATN